MGLTHDSVTSGCNFQFWFGFLLPIFSNFNCSGWPHFLEWWCNSKCKISKRKKLPHVGSQPHEMWMVIKKEKFVISNPSSYHHHHESFCWIVPFDGCCHVWHGSCRLLLLLFTTKVEQTFYGPVVPRSHHRWYQSCKCSAFEDLF